MHTLEMNPALMTEIEREKVREQMDRLLETHHFRNSRRYPPLLRFIVEETLEGRGEYLKERLLGVSVFDRPPDYDTATDPIVRVTVAEIRKRIAQYYHDEAHDSEIRIELLPGRYVAEFRAHRESLPERPQAARSHAADSVDTSPSLPHDNIEIAHGSLESSAGLQVLRRSYRRWYIVSSVVLAAVLATFVLLRWADPSSLDQLWAPILSSPHAVLFCLPTDVGKNSDFSKMFPTELRQPDHPIAIPTDHAEKISALSFLGYESLGENIVYSDMLATLNMVNVIVAHHHDYHVKLNVATSLDDLRNGPDILVGGMDNQWTMRALAPLRYHFAGSDQTKYWIADSQNPANQAWSLDLKENYAAITHDYAIIARVHSDDAGQQELIIAGIGMSGTAAAGELVGNEKRTEELRRRIGSGFKNHDFEVVLGTDVVNGIAGSPKILAVAVW